MRAGAAGGNIKRSGVRGCGATDVARGEAGASFSVFVDMFALCLQSSSLSKGNVMVLDKLESAFESLIEGRCDEKRIC